MITTSDWINAAYPSRHTTCFELHGPGKCGGGVGCVDARRQLLGVIAPADNLQTPLDGNPHVSVPAHYYTNPSNAMAQCQAKKSKDKRMHALVATLATCLWDETLGVWDGEWDGDWNSDWDRPCMGWLSGPDRSARHRRKHALFLGFGFPTTAAGASHGGLVPVTTQAPGTVRLILAPSHPPHTPSTPLSPHSSFCLDVQWQ